MKKEMLNQKQSNKGFTLVEVLVAIMILAIIVVPLLSAFVVSARTNAKARQTMRATTLAQNVMEELKAYSLETSANHHNGTETGNYVVTNAEKTYETVLGTNGVHKAVKVTTVEITDPVTNEVTTDVTIDGRANERYDFVLGGVKQESAEFDVEINVRKPAESDEKKNIENFPAELGSLEMVNIVSMNRSDCAYFAQESGAHSIVASEFARRSELNGTPISATTLQSMMTRTITIDVNSAVDGSETVKVTYEYLIPSDYVTEDNRIYTEYTTIFDNYASKEELKSVYLYYNPLYGVSVRDKIVVNNNNDLGINVYLIKMKDATYNAYDDAGYKPSIAVNEQNAQANNTSHVKLCTNITRANLNLQYSAAGVTPQLRVSDLGNSENIQNLYDVTINIYKHDAITLDNESGDTTIAFDENKKIATFTGTVLDKAD